jgi:hypothetical protein
MNGSGITQSGSGHLEVGVPTEQDRARSALRHIDPDCPYDEWVRIGMAAQAAGLTFDDFLNWSAAAENYVGENDCRTKWKSFDAQGGVTAATLFKVARDQGWRDSALRTNHAVNMPVAKQKAIPPKFATRTENPKAVHVWEMCDPAPADHPYIVKKGGSPATLRVYPTTAPELIIRDKDGAHSAAGWLVVPCMADDRLQTLQLISAEGRKLNLPGASFNDGLFVVGQFSASDVIYTAEGLGQAWAIHAATGAPAVVTFGAGRMAVVAAAVRVRYPAARLVLVPDRGKENQAQAIAAKLNCAWFELPAEKPINYDVNDYLLEDGATALSELAQAAKMTPMRYRLLSGLDLSLLPPLRWMVRGILPLEGLAALYGPSGAGKSFLVLDIAAAVAGGQHDWFGRKVTQRPVTYCALEGESGMGKRVTAWTEHHNRPVPGALRFMAQPFDLLASGDVIDLAKAVQVASGAGGLVIIDTLNRAAPGADENSSVDMGNLIAAAKRLQDLTGGLVLLVHHTGKDASKGLRGHSSLYAALDGAIEVSRADGRREWGVAKSKDDETGQVHAFRLEVVTVGFDDDGDEVTSCVVVADDAGRIVKRAKLPQGGNQKIALDTLGKPLRESKAFNKDGAPPGHPCIRLDEALMLVAERLPCEAKRRNERAQQALNALVAKNIYGVKGDWLWRV